MYSQAFDEFCQYILDETQGAGRSRVDKRENKAYWTGYVDGITEGETLTKAQEAYVRKALLKED